MSYSEWLDWTASGTQVQEVQQAILDGDEDREIVESALLGASEEMARYHQERREHNADGYFARWAGGDECKALGHHKPMEDEYADTDAGQMAFWAAHDEWTEEHPHGWDGTRLCLATRYGSACMTCEDEDCYFDMGQLTGIWTLPGVAADDEIRSEQ